MVVYIISALDIVNVSSPKKLTKLFYDAGYGLQNNIEPGSMTYYTDPTSGNKYLWYGVRYQINDTQFTSGLTSDVFSRDFDQYDTLSGVPFGIVNMTSTFIHDHVNELFGNQMCTSPFNNDIMT